MQAAAAGKKRESEMLESQLRKQLHDTQEKLREVQEQGQQELEPAVDSLDSQEDPDKSQVQGLIHARQEHNLSKRRYDLF